MADAESNQTPRTRADLLDAALAALNTYVVFTGQHYPKAATLWTAVTHGMEAWNAAPRLVITSPQKRCAKSRLLDVITGMCHDPLSTTDATVAAIFRSIGESPPTLIFDEADAMFGTKKQAENNEDLRALINAGHQRGRTVLRCVGPRHDPTEFPCFAMVALAGKGTGWVPDTISDRAISITMQRRAKYEPVSTYRIRRDEERLHILRDELAAWIKPLIEELKAAEPKMPVDDRAADTWEPLIAIADAAGGHWPEWARAACKAMVEGAEAADEDQQLSIKLLADIRVAFDAKQVLFLGSAELTDALRSMVDSPWCSFDLNPSKLAFRLRDFGIKPGHNSMKTARGYSLEHFQDTFGRYLRPSPRPDPSSPSATPSEQEERWDGQNPPDGLGRPDEFTRPTETTGQTPTRTPWTGSDAPLEPDGPKSPAWEPNGSCPDCGRTGTTVLSNTGRCLRCSLLSKVSTDNAERDEDG